MYVVLKNIRNILFVYCLRKADKLSNHILFWLNMCPSKQLSSTINDFKCPKSS